MSGLRQRAEGPGAGRDAVTVCPDHLRVMEWLGFVRDDGPPLGASCDLCAGPVVLSSGAEIAPCPGCRALTLIHRLLGETRIHAGPEHVAGCFLRGPAPDAPDEDRPARPGPGMDVCPGCGADVPTAERKAHALTNLLQCQHEDTISVEIEGGRKVETCEECGAFRPAVSQSGVWRLPPLVQWLADALGRQENEPLARADVPDINAEDIVKRAIEGVRQHKIEGSRRRPPEPLWCRVRDLFGYGSTVSANICTVFGFSPHEVYRPDGAA